MNRFQIKEYKPVSQEYVEAELKRNSPGRTCPICHGDVDYLTEHNNLMPNSAIHIDCFYKLLPKKLENALKPLIEEKEKFMKDNEVSKEEEDYINKMIEDSANKSLNKKIKKDKE